MTYFLLKRTGCARHVHCREKFIRIFEPSLVVSSRNAYNFLYLSVRLNFLQKREGLIIILYKLIRFISEHKKACIMQKSCSFINLMEILDHATRIRDCRIAQCR